MRNKRLLFGALSGAALMFYLDPDKGRRRRALLRDKLVKLRNTVADRVDTIAEMTADRAQGVMAETARGFIPDHAGDETIVARVRSEMGRWVSHPRAIDVTAENGRVTLTGSILSEEVQPFVNTVGTVRGVTSVDNRLQVFEDAASIPELQGGKTRTELLD